MKKQHPSSSPKTSKKRMFGRPDHHRTGDGIGFSPFAKAVFAIVAKIPRGKTLTYGQVAEIAGRPSASRAAGNILSTNWDPKIPCPRVIRADGKMGGYNHGGAEMKLRRLKEEGAIKR